MLREWCCEFFSIARHELSTWVILTTRNMPFLLDDHAGGVRVRQLPAEVSRGRYVTPHRLSNKELAGFKSVWTLMHSHIHLCWVMRAAEHVWNTLKFHHIWNSFFIVCQIFCPTSSCPLSSLYLTFFFIPTAFLGLNELVNFVSPIWNICNAIICQSYKSII